MASLRHVCVALFALLVVLACSSSSSLGLLVAASCTPAAKFSSGDQINVAILVWLIDQPHGLYTGSLADTTPTAFPGYGTTLVQPYMAGVDLYVQKMRARGGNLPLPSGQSVNVNYVYINLAYTSDFVPNTKPDYSVVDPATNFPIFMIYTSFPGIPFSASSAGGMFDKVTSKDPAALMANFGISQPFTYIVPSILTLDGPSAALMNKVEDLQSHVVVHPFAASKEIFVCDGISPTATNPATETKDCLDPALGRNRRQGARRFQTLFSTLFDSTANQHAALDSFHALGVKTLVIIQDMHASGGSTFAKWASISTQEAAAQLNIQFLGLFKAENGVNCDPLTAPNNQTAPNCPPPEVFKFQGQVFTGGRTGAQVAQELKELNADALILLSAPRSPASWTFARMFEAMKAIGYTPKVISAGGGADQGIIPFLKDPLDLANAWTTKPWDQRLKGPSYKNIPTDTQFELLPANATHDGPAVFFDAFENAYGPRSNRGAGGKGAHPFYISDWTVSCAATIGWSTLILVQKLIEASETLDVPTILASAKSISTPGVYHQVQFDQYGRTSRVNEILVQKTKDVNNPLLLAPYNIGSPPIYPLPTWEEREFKPVFYSQKEEQIMLAINTICIALCVLLTGVVLANWRAPVIRAATPSFCLVIIGGGVSMLMSNYFNTLVVNDSHCAANVWFLTLGFSLIFASLFIKTFRIWRIFGRQKLKVLKMKDSDLLMAVCAFLLVDFIINAAWQGSGGMHVKEVTVDPQRPAYNYLTCDFDGAVGAIYTHLALKGGLLLFGVGLTFAVRNTPSQFNESSLIGLSIYNVSFVICFIVPILAVGLGGRSTVYLIRNYAVMFVVLTTLGLLYVPKILTLTNSSLVTQTMTHNDDGTTGKPGRGTRLDTADGSETPDPASPKAMSGVSSPTSPKKGLIYPVGNEQQALSMPSGNQAQVSGNDSTALHTRAISGHGGAAVPSDQPATMVEMPEVANKYVDINTPLPAAE